MIGVAHCFDSEGVTVPVSAITPLKALRTTAKDSAKYRQILRSITSVGLVEPPVVMPDKSGSGRYFLLDGHMRLEALKDLGISDVTCLVSHQDDTFTYNKRINRLSAAQEHKMVVRAIGRGVSEARIAEALGLDVVSVRRRAKLLDRICPEATDLLRDTTCPMAVYDILRRMAPLRQIEAAELMVGQNNFSKAFAQALLLSTPDAQIVGRRPPGPGSNVSREHLARLEQELSSLQSQVKAVEESYGIENLQLTVARGYISKLVSNARVARWLSERQPEFLAEFQALSETSTFPTAGVRTSA